MRKIATLNFDREVLIVPPEFGLPKQRRADFYTEDSKYIQSVFFQSNHGFTVAKASNFTTAAWAEILEA